MVTDVSADVLEFHYFVGPFPVPAPCHVCGLFPSCVSKVVFPIVATVAVHTMVASICTLVTVAFAPSSSGWNHELVLCSLRFVTGP